jgi:hypothetical protein
MPCGVCDQCRQHDVFIYPVAAFGSLVFACAQCLNLPEVRLEDVEDDDDYDDYKVISAEV